MPRRILLWAGLLTLLLLSSQARAETEYPLINSSFESPTLDINNSWYGGVDGWFATTGMGTTWEIPWAEPSPADDGDQYVFADFDDWHLYQTAGTVAADTRYWFEVSLYPMSSGTSRAEIYVEETSTWTTFIQKVHKPSWDPGREDFALPSGQWTRVRFGFNSAAFASYVGNGLRVRVSGSRLAVDNPKLYYDANPRDFYISSVSGSNANDGKTSGAAWADFTKLAGFMPLLPGETVLLERGSMFTQELRLSGKGNSANPIELTAYGTGDRPRITRSDLANDLCIVWDGPHYARINQMDCRNAKMGIYLRYINDVGNQNVIIDDCHLEGMTDTTLEPADHDYEFAWSNGIHMGGKVWGDNETVTVLDGLTITNTTAVNCAHGFGTGWYYPAVYRSRLRNLIMEDNLALDCINGWMTLISVDGGHMHRCHSLGGGGVDVWTGTTLGMIQSSANFTIDDCEFAYLDRNQAGDGSGFDFEGNTVNVTFTNNTIHDNDAAALLILSTDGPHSNLTISNNVFYNNALDPWNSEINSEIQNSNSLNTGIISNNGIYRANSNINFWSPANNWSGFTRTNNRTGEYYDYGSRPVWWDWETDTDLEGWYGFNQWTSNTVSSGILWGLATGNDPFAHSPASWANTTLSPYVWVRMRQTAGTAAQIFYITDADPVWNEAKSKVFPITADGNYYDYFVDLDSASHKGVITQVRLDPTMVSGSNMGIDHVRLTDSTDPLQDPPSALPAVPQEMVFVSIASEDGYVLESAQNSGIGGSLSTSGQTFNIGDDASNRAFRPMLSFDTSALPDDAQIVDATIGITRVGGITGSIPIGVANSFYGDILVDVASPHFGTGSTMVTSDFQATATKAAASKFAWPAYSDGMTIYSRLEAADNNLINLTGRTQYRIRYQNDDDGDGTADYIAYASGDNSNAAQRPTLKVRYYSSAPSWTTLIYDDFELNWGNYTDGGGDCALSSSNAYQGTYCANIQDNSGTASSFYSRDLDFHNPGYTKIQVDFWFKGVSMETNENFFVEFYDGSTWHIVADFVQPTNFVNNVFLQGTVLIDEQYYNFPTNGKIRFRCDASGNADDVYIDQITVSVQ